MGAGALHQTLGVLWQADQLDSNRLQLQWDYWLGRCGFSDMMRWHKFTSWCTLCIPACPAAGMRHVLQAE